MRKYSVILAAIIATATMVSCSKEIEAIDTQKEKESDGTVTLRIKATQTPDTRTFIDGTDVKWASSDEKLAVFEQAGTDVSKSTSKEGVTEDGGVTMSFETTLSEKTASSFTYYAFYPEGAYQSGTTVSSVAINTIASQTPTNTSFDPTADLLIAKKVENGNTQATSLNMSFARAVAVGKMTIKNLPCAESVEKIFFSAKNGSNDVVLAGRTPFNLETAEPAGDYGKNVSEKEIILDYSSLALTANSDDGMDAFFTCYPFELGPGDSFTVKVKTENYTYTRTVNLTGTQKLAFKAGKASVFAVNMADVESSENAVDLCYAYLTADEYHTAGGATSYSNLTVEKAHGDNWETYAHYSSNSIGIRNNSSGTNDSYVKLPEFKDNISSVIVTLGTTLEAGKTLTLESSATANTGSIASLTTVANQTTYAFDLSEKSVKTAYLRSNGAQALVSKIEVYAGTDSRGNAQAAPTNVSAEVNSETVNAIELTPAGERQCLTILF